MLILEINENENEIFGSFKTLQGKENRENVEKHENQPEKISFFFEKKYYPTH